ncbi:MAG: ATPase, T2SS/T4P/T4SS family, partial [Hyphomicrobiaceae bacterium]
MTSQASAARAVGLDPRSEAFVEELGQFLLQQGTLDELAVHRAQRAQRQSGERFDLVLTRLGLVPEANMARLLAEFLGVALADAKDLPEVALLADRLQLSFLMGNRIIPLAEQGDTLVVAAADPFNREPIEAIGYLLGRPVEQRIMGAGEIERALERLYGRGATVSDEAAPTASERASEDDVRRLEDMASEAPIIRLVHDMIARAVEAQASDIHVEPREDSLRMRFRLDGMLHTVETLPLSLRAAVTSRIKIMANLNIAERRLPQDGRIKTTVRGREIDLRISTMPTLSGESVVMRILDRSSVQLDFTALGFAGPAHEAFARLLDQPNGIILVTGPTGSGKTTTLYTALNALNTTERKTFTVEDPIEYQLVGVNQVQVLPKIGLTFATALRSMLRQDPDIIMVGEIRDLETAQMSIQASLTGHLVLSTVHTNSAA